MIKNIIKKYIRGSADLSHEMMDRVLKGGFTLLPHNIDIHNVNNPKKNFEVSIIVPVMDAIQVFINDSVGRGVLSKEQIMGDIRAIDKSGIALTVGGYVLHTNTHMASCQVKYPSHYTGYTILFIDGLVFMDRHNDGLLTVHAQYTDGVDLPIWKEIHREQITVRCDFFPEDETLKPVNLMAYTLQFWRAARLFAHRNNLMAVYDEGRSCSAIPSHVAIANPDSIGDNFRERMEKLIMDTRLASEVQHRSKVADGILKEHFEIYKELLLEVQSLLTVGPAN